MSLRTSKPKSCASVYVILCCTWWESDDVQWSVIVLSNLRYTTRLRLVLYRSLILLEHQHCYCLQGHGESTITFLSRNNRHGHSPSGPIVYESWTPVVRHLTEDLPDMVDFKREVDSVWSFLATRDRSRWFLDQSHQSGRSVLTDAQTPGNCGLPALVT